MKTQLRKAFWFHTFLSISLLSLFLSGCGRTRERFEFDPFSRFVTDDNTNLPSTSIPPTLEPPPEPAPIPRPEPTLPVRPLQCAISFVTQGFQVGQQSQFAVYDQWSGMPLMVSNAWTLDPSEQAFRPQHSPYGHSLNQFSFIFRSGGFKTLFVRAAPAYSSTHSLYSPAPTQYCDTQISFNVAPAAAIDLCAFYPQLCHSNQPKRCTFAAQWVGVRNADCGSNKCNKRVEATLNDGIRLPSDARDIQMQIKSLYLDNDDKKARISINGSQVIRETDNFYNSTPNVSIGYLLRGGSNSVSVSVKSVKRYWSAVFSVSGEYYSPSGKCDHSFGYR